MTRDLTGIVLALWREEFDAMALRRMLALRTKHPDALPMAIAGYDRGESLSAIAKGAGISARDASDLLRLVGRGDFWRGLPPTHKKRRERQDKHAAIAASYLAGVHVRDIAREQNVSLRRVYDATRAAGLPARNRRAGRKDRPILRYKKVRAADQSQSGRAP